ncbi:MAG: hypothetical protein ACYC1D_02315 [Acidimicrobiales bacterium]
MTATTTMPGGFRPRMARTQETRNSLREADRQAYLGRWLKVWIALSVVVILVVVAYLIFIGNALASINGNLAVAQRAVTGAGGHTATLPSQIAGINSSLGGINSALQAIPGQGNQIVSNLTSIEGHLTTIDTSLKSTSPMLQQVAGTLVGTSGTLGNISSTLGGTSSTLGGTSSTLANTASDLTGITSNLNGIAPSLVDTSNVLVSVLGLANNINGTLNAANLPAGNCTAPETMSMYPAGNTTVGNFSCQPNQIGVQNIHQRVSIANNVLSPAQADLTNIVAGLQSINGHLTRACGSTAVRLVAGTTGGHQGC